MAPGLSKKRRVEWRETSPRKRSRPDATKPEDHVMPFRFMDLPAELRNNCYEKVIEIYPDVWLSRNTARHNLATKSGLVGVSQQVRDEFLGVLLLAAPDIRTTVRNFHFGHIISFINRLSDAELHSMFSKDATLPRERQIIIHFFRDGIIPTAFDQLRRWLNRVQHPTKKGTKIHFEYVMLRDKDKDLSNPGRWTYYDGRQYLDNLLSYQQHGTRSQVEANKMKAAIARGPHDTTSMDSDPDL